jgi:hypothetical protein
MVLYAYQICTAYFSQVMLFIVAWLYTVRRGKGTGHPTPFNSWLSTPRGCGMGCAVCVFMSGWYGVCCMCIYEYVPACACAGICVCMGVWVGAIQPAFEPITVHTCVILSKAVVVFQHLGFGIDWGNICWIIPLKNKIILPKL